jgi:hypothetical protein
MKLDIGQFTISSSDSGWQLLSGDEVVSSHPGLGPCLRALSRETLLTADFDSVKAMIDGIERLEATIRATRFEHAGIVDPKSEKPEPAPAPKAINKVERAFQALFGRESDESVVDTVALKEIVGAMRGATHFFTSDEIETIKRAANESD